MNVKQIFLSLAVSASCAGVFAQDMPSFGGNDSEGWYYVVFRYGDTCIRDYGEGRNAVTRYVIPGEESMLWKLEGSSDSFTMRSKLGNYASMPGYFTSSTDAGQATSFRLVKSPVPGFEDSWEVEIIGKGDDYNHLNQYGGGLPGKNIGGWTAGDANNAIYFIPQASLPSSYMAAPAHSEFKVSPLENYAPEHRHTLWYTKPVTAESVSDPWMEYALPVGNGEFGAMVYGGVKADHIQFNDKSVWTGSSTLRGSYQNFGDLYIEDISGIFGNSDETAISNYVRNLDLEEAKANVSYTSPDGSVSFTREYISSFPDKVVAIRLAADAPGKISVRLSLFPGVQKGIVNASYADGCGEFEGRLTLVDYKAKFKAIPTGGVMSASENGVEVNGADELLIILGGATNFDQHSLSYISDAEVMRSMVDTRVQNAAGKGWESLLADHLADYQPLFNRVKFNISAAMNSMSVPDMISNYNKRRADRLHPANLMLEELYYSFGRYLLISSSRGMDSPANLQGIWNNSANPAWQSDIHSNINVQMNYWPAETANLSEMHLPYLNYIYSMALEHKEWQEYARRSGQTVGWTCFTQNNIFGHSDYAENYVIANAWYTSHLWKHYKFTLDYQFLKEKAFPVMESCVRFWLERLVKDEDGTWVAPKEWSPEHGPSEEDATAHAQQILVELFSSTLEAVSILGDDAGVEESFVAELKEKFQHLDKGLAIETYSGEWGGDLNGVLTGDPILREWKYSDFSAGEKEHRHQSHLMALFPFNQISPESEFFTPAVNALRMHGDVSTGWSLAWRLALWARAQDGSHAHNIIKNALRHASSYGQSSGAGGIYSNLLDSHAPFQIDGNFGFTAAVTEMLLQSHGGVIRLLPALSPYWVDGEVRGLRGEGNFEIDEKWSNGKVIQAVVHSGSGIECRLNSADIASAEIKDQNGNHVETVVLDSDNILFPTDEGGVYTIDFSDNSLVGSIPEDKLSLIVENGIARVNRMDAVISAYDVNGCKLAQNTGSFLDISEFHHTPMIVKATTSSETVVCKCFLK